MQVQLQIATVKHNNVLRMIQSTVSLDELSEEIFFAKSIPHY